MPKDEKPRPANIPAPGPVDEMPNVDIQPPPLTWLQKSYYKGKSSTDGSDTAGAHQED